MVFDEQCWHGWSAMFVSPQLFVFGGGHDDSREDGLLPVP